jgi:hypothetical protein
MSGTVMVKGYTETETGFTKIRHSPFGAELILEGIDSILSASNSEEIVDVHRNEEYSGISPAVVNTMFALKVFEPPGKHCFIHRLVPNKATLFHTVQSFLQLPYPIRVIFIDETFGLLHVADFVGLE